MNEIPKPALKELVPLGSFNEKNDPEVEKLVDAMSAILTMCADLEPVIGRQGLVCVSARVCGFLCFGLHGEQEPDKVRGMINTYLQTGMKDRIAAETLYHEDKANAEPS